MVKSTMNEIKEQVSDIPDFQTGMNLLENEMDYQRQVGSETAAAAIEWAFGELKRMRSALTEWEELGKKIPRLRDDLKALRGGKCAE